MRIIIIGLVIVLVYIIAKSLLEKKISIIKKRKRSIQYCKYCNAYVADKDCCDNNNENYRNCKNYKWDLNEKSAIINNIDYNYVYRDSINSHSPIKICS